MGGGTEKLTHFFGQYLYVYCKVRHLSRKRRIFIGFFRLFYTLLIERYGVFAGKVRHMNERIQKLPTV